MITSPWLSHYKLQESTEFKITVTESIGIQ